MNHDLDRRSFLKSAALSGLALASRKGWSEVNSADSVAPQRLAQFVNVFVGTGGHGHTYPGATVPFGMVQLSPDTGTEGWDHCSGYHRSDTSIMGFSHTHLSGTGVGDMLDVLLMPSVGEVHIEPGTPENPDAGYRARFRPEDEHAEPGYYSVVLRDHGIKAEFTASARVGMHRYTLPANPSTHFIVDLAHGYGSPDGHGHVLSSEVSVVGSDTLVGGRRVGAWANGRHIYFAIRFSRPFKAATLVAGRAMLDAALRHAEGKSLKCVLTFPTSRSEVVLVKVGLSGVSTEGALKNLDKEVPGWDFDAVRSAAIQSWEKELRKIIIETSREDHKSIFYSALYHSLLAPTLFSDVDGQYRGMDLKVRQLPSGANNYSTYSLWDTYRALHPLYTLVQSERLPDLLNAMIRMAEESPAGVPVWPLQGCETG